MLAFLSYVLGNWRKIPPAYVVVFVGMALVSFAAALVYLPAGIMVGGVLLILAAVDMRS